MSRQWHFIRITFRVEIYCYPNPIAHGLICLLSGDKISRIREVIVRIFSLHRLFAHSIKIINLMLNLKLIFMVLSLVYLHGMTGVFIDMESWQSRPKKWQRLCRWIFTDDLVCNEICEETITISNIIYLKTINFWNRLTQYLKKVI